MSGDLPARFVPSGRPLLDAALLEPTAEDMVRARRLVAHDAHEASLRTSEAVVLRVCVPHLVAELTRPWADPTYTIRTLLATVRAAEERREQLRAGGAW